MVLEIYVVTAYDVGANILWRREASATTIQIYAASPIPRYLETLRIYYI